MLPYDFSPLHAVAIALIFLCWFAYTAVLHRFGRGSLNSQLVVVRQRWLMSATQRQAKPFDAVLLGHISNSIAFFGSATLIVLAGFISTFAHIKSLHQTASELHFVGNTSLELFALKLGLVALVLTICFFSFTYALRKLIYTIALLGALPDKSEGHASLPNMVEATSIVLSQAITTFNFGIRGYYYTVPALCLLISPAVSIGATLIATVILFYRQLGTPTARAIQAYADAAQKDGG
jgi:uncharacterized membrane protein